MTDERKNGPEIKRLERRIERATWWFYVWITVAVLSVSFAVIGPLRGWVSDSAWWLALWIVYAAAALIAAAVNRIRVRFAEQDQRRLTFEDDLRCDVPKPERWAFKLLSANEDELRRYYQITLTQSAWIFLVGLISLAGGFVIIAVTFAQLQRNIPDKTLVAAVGAVGTIGAQMVGAIFMRMNKTIATNFQAFHGRLVDTHQILFGNLLGNRIENVRRRSETWAQMALALMRLPASAATPIPADAAPPASGAISPVQAKVVADTLNQQRPAQPPF